jgi:biotin carboxyl carrier protein
MKKFKFAINGHDYDVEIMKFEDNMATIEVNGTPYQIDIQHEVKQSKTPKLVRQEVITKRSDSKIKKTITKTEGHEVKIPLPGNIVNIFVKEGDVVKLGDKLMMYEAMKMENTVVAEKDGVVKNIRVKIGDNVLQGSVLLEIA